MASFPDQVRLGEPAFVEEIRGLAEESADKAYRLVAADKNKPLWVMPVGNYCHWVSATFAVTLLESLQASSVAFDSITVVGCGRALNKDSFSHYFPVVFGQGLIVAADPTWRQFGGGEQSPNVIVAAKENLIRQLLHAGVSTKSIENNWGYQVETQGWTPVLSEALPGGSHIVRSREIEVPGIKPITFTPATARSTQSSTHNRPADLVSPEPDRPLDR